VAPRRRRRRDYNHNLNRLLHVPLSAAILQQILPPGCKAARSDADQLGYAFPREGTSMLKVQH
jgi:hypothetical protein